MYNIRMSTVVYKGLLKIIVPANDHLPPHCHAIKGRGLGNCEFNARIYILDGSFEVVSGTITKAEWRILKEMYSNNLEIIRDKFNEIHGVDDEEA